MLVFCNFSSNPGSYTESLHRTIMPGRYFHHLRWCRVERCPNLEVVFPFGAMEAGDCLQTIWTSDLRTARCIWSKGKVSFLALSYFKSPRHLYLRSCPSLQYALPLWFASITLHLLLLLLTLWLISLWFCLQTGLAGRGVCVACD
ncbi:hypothetical protein SETIT_6G012400v2 [Setaria italica]|uniref:Uncharacterized protein n=1 Tax=Setaria italica TaxID=4555 RepID=A0A368RIL8_SETIT|nr:hypothetical protein SETIT_6G012400v2 [Setaria italica]